MVHRYRAQPGEERRALVDQALAALQAAGCQADTWLVDNVCLSWLGAGGDWQRVRDAAFARRAEMVPDDSVRLQLEDAVYVGDARGVVQVQGRDAHLLAGRVVPVRTGPGWGEFAICGALLERADRAASYAVMAIAAAPGTSSKQGCISCRRDRTLVGMPPRFRVHRLPGSERHCPMSGEFPGLGGRTR
jgi:hypothetical protein